MEKADRILFIISIDGKKIGHIGVNRYIQKNNSAAIDNVLRGIRKDYPGLMKNASIAIMKWMFDELGLTKITFERATTTANKCHKGASGSSKRIIFFQTKEIVSGNWNAV